MKIAVLGTGQVGQTIGERLFRLGHEVTLGSRDPGSKGHLTVPILTYAEATSQADWIINALPGEAALAILGACQTDGKILIDLGNYDHAVDQPITRPLGQAIQDAFPEARVVKTLNSVSAHLMAEPSALDAPHSVFIASNDATAKLDVTAWLQSLGWSDIIDLGDLHACRAMEQLIPLWMALERQIGGPAFNLRVVR